MKTINNLSINEFQRKNNISTKDMKLLMEAFRRKHFLNTDSPKFYGLGTPSTYKSSYFTASFNELPRVSNWYRLTTSGEEIMQKMEKFFAIPKNPKTKSKINSELFAY